MEFGGRFGLSLRDMDKVTTWLRSEGFTVDHVSRSMNFITFSGTAAQVDRALHTGLHLFLVDGQTHFANTQPPSVPAALAGVVLNFTGLHDFRLQPQHLKVSKITPEFTSGTTHYLAPGDVASIYDITPLYSAGFTGTNQSLVIAGQTAINLTDISSFRTKFGLSANVPQLVLSGTSPGTTSDLIEADLDIEWSGAVAQNAKIIYVYSTNVLNSVQYAVSENYAPVISFSYAVCEANDTAYASMQTTAQQANALGITWLASSGDAGAAACDSGATTATHGLAVNLPASIPEVTGVGGTEFNEGSGTFWNTTNGSTGGSAAGYIPEKAWNDSTSASLIATGGGKSTYFAKPTWQTGAGVPADSARDVPDVSLSASANHDGYYIYSGGVLESVGGTSASTPSFAGIVALLNQYLLSKGVITKAGLGNINPNLYHLAAGTTSPFHDITTGNNNVPCTAGTTNCTGTTIGYSAGVGYDQTTGLGSVDANTLATTWASLPTVVSTTTTLAASPASISTTASTTLTATVKPATGTTVPTGSVTFAKGATTLGTVSLASGAASLSVTGATLGTGSDSITTTYGGSSAFGGSNGSATVTVTAAAVGTTTTLTASPTTIASTASTTLTVTVKAASGTPTGTVTFTVGSNTLGTATLSSGTATLSVAGTKLAVGSNTITASYAATTGFGASSGTATVTVTAAAVGTTTTLTASPTSIASTASTTLTATVKAASGTATPTGTVTFSVGGTTLGTATLSSGTATLAVAGTKLAVGSNTITASYAATTGFSASSGTATVTVTASTVATTTTVAASSATLATSTATSTLTVTVTPASGTTAPTGTVTFTLGSTSLGTGTLTASGSKGVATLTVKGSQLAVGSNTVTVSYAGSTAFGASKTTIALSRTK